MGSIWNRMRSNSTADRNQSAEMTSGDSPTQPHPPSELIDQSSKENNANKSPSPPQATCEERIHYPIYDPLNPRHNPVITRTRSTVWANCFPTTPRSKAVQSSKSGIWTSKSPVRSLRKVKSGFLALAEELRSKPSPNRGDSALKSTASSSDPASPIKQDSKDIGDINGVAESPSPVTSPSNAAPILKLDIASSQMSLSPFSTSPSVSSKDKKISFDNTSLSRPHLGSPDLSAATIRPTLSYDGPSFLPVPEIHSPLEDPFQSPTQQSVHPEDITDLDDNSANIVQGSLDAKHDGVSLGTATGEENYLEIKNCNTGNSKDASLEKPNISPTDVCSSPAAATQQQVDPNGYHAGNNSETDIGEKQSPSTQSPKVQGKACEPTVIPSLMETKTSAEDGLDSVHVNSGDFDSNNLIVQDRHDRLSETSTDEDSDFGVEIYRTECLSEQNPEPSSPNTVETMAAGPMFSEDGEKLKGLDRFERSSQDSNIQATRTTTGAGQQSMESKQLISEDSSSNSTIRLEDRPMKHAVPDTDLGCSPARPALRKLRSRQSKASSLISQIEAAQDDIQPPSPSSPSSDSHHRSIGAKNDTPLAPSGDLCYAVEAIERESGLQFNSSSETLSLPASGGNDSISTEQIPKDAPSREDNESLSCRLNSRCTTLSTGRSESHDGEATSARIESSIRLTGDCTKQGEGRTNFDRGLAQNGSSGDSSTESSQADMRSDATAIGTYSTDSSAFDSDTTQGIQPTNIKAKDADPRMSTTKESSEVSQAVCYRIVSDGSIHSGPGLDREIPSNSAYNVLPEAIGPGGPHVGENKSRGSQSNTTADWSSGSEDCGFAPWYPHNKPS